MTKTISSAVFHNITISSAAYPSPVSITSRGDIFANDTGSAAVQMVTPGASLQNSGFIRGAYNNYSTAGGAGISATGGTITNFGTIQAGYGRINSAPGADGVDLAAGSVLTNSYTADITKPGYIVGGQNRGSGPGGLGVSIASGTTLDNIGGRIKGGSDYFYHGGNGGAGVYLAAGGTLINAGPADQQSGDARIYGGTGYGGGVGVILASGASFTNGNIVGDVSSTNGKGFAGVYGGENYSATGAGGAGVYAHSGATLTNDVNAVITGGELRAHSFPTDLALDTGNGGDGVDLAASAHGINYGDIFGGNEIGTYTGGTGVSLAAGATFTNAATGKIQAGGGVIDKRGTAPGGTGGAGAYVGSNAVLVNLGQGTYQQHGIQRTPAYGITGGAALVGGAGVILNGGTFVNAGLVVGGYNGIHGGTGNNRADAVQFGTQAGTLVVESGFDFLGNVVAVSGVADVLEVSGSSTIALSGIGTQFQNFDHIAFADGAAWTISGNSSGLAGGAAISGFTRDDKIDLTDFAATSKNYVAGTGLVLSDGSHSVTLDITGNFTTADFSIGTDGASGTLIGDTAPCYCPGTLIETRHGRKEVEALEIGDEVMTAAGALRPIKWIGRRSYAGRFIMGRKDLLPVCIKGGAIADNVPQRDLWISPHHAMFFADQNGDGVLIEARDLVNGTSIVQAGHVDEVEYFHIELETHDVIIAEGALSESFVDDDSRFMFHNASEYADLYPTEVRRAPRYCAPRLDYGYEVEAVRQRLVLRSRPQARAHGAFLSSRVLV